MAEQTTQRDEELFMLLVTNFHQMAMIGMGKLVNPSTGKAGRDLPQARFAIDMLEMLVRRTQSALSQAEDKYLQTLLTELRLNYVDEANKPESGAPSDSEEGADAGTPDEGQPADQSAASGEETDASVSSKSDADDTAGNGDSAASSTGSSADAKE